MPLPPSDDPAIPVSVSIRQSVLDKARSQANKIDRPMSWVVNAALEEYLTRHAGEIQRGVSRSPGAVIDEIEIEPG
jgi:predicted transcriptional regulator